VKFEKVEQHDYDSGKRNTTAVTETTTKAKAD
jgi:hypothetical protein